jgi:hypothetical protein
MSSSNICRQESHFTAAQGTHIPTLEFQNAVMRVCIRQDALHHSIVTCLEVLTAANVKMTAFWDKATCSLVEIARHFRGEYCLHHYPDNGGSTNL